MTTRTLQTGTDHLQCTVTDHVALITMNNPSKRNALSSELTPALGRMLQETETDPDVRVLVLTGAGSAFCAGGDIGGMGASLAGGSGRPDTEAMIRRLQTAQDAVSLRLYDYAKPTIAALPGAAAGAGMSIALACDLRVAAQNAVLVPAFGAIGLSGDFGGSWLLSRLLGPGRAKEIYFTGQRISADDGLALGVFNRVLPNETMMSGTMALASELAMAAPIALRFMKDNINRGMSTDFRTALRGEADRMIRSMMTDDHKAAAKAFLEKRAPEFKGQ